MHRGAFIIKIRYHSVLRRMMVSTVFFFYFASNCHAENEIHVREAYLIDGVTVNNLLSVII